jgi:hypothetical protein
MKIRKSFVSNSSSCSFIVIDASGGYEHEDPNLGKDLSIQERILTAGDDIGVTEFGWGPEILVDCGSRINFAYLQALYADNQDWIQMLEEVIKEGLIVTKIVWNMQIETSDLVTSYSYIDHQSVGGNNTEMFDSKEILKDFIFGTKSKVRLDHDNH